MPIEIKIDDSDVDGFSKPAKKRLEEAVKEYASALILESNRIEVGRNSGSGPPEVTQGMVSDAVIVRGRALGTHQTRSSSKLVKIISAILTVAVGVMYDRTLLQKPLYLAIFIMVLGSAIVTNTISILRE